MGSDMTVSGLDNLGRCCDLLDLDPLGIVDSCKSTRAILTVEDTLKTYKLKDGTSTYELPLGVKMKSPRKLKVDGGSSLMSNSYDFQREFQSSMTISGGVDGVFGFSASKSVKEIQRQSESREEIFTYVLANCAIHIVNFNLQGTDAKELVLDDDFKASVVNLPAHEDRAAYSGFIRTFGTHFLSQVALGGMAWSRVSSRKEKVQSSSESQRVFTTEAKAELKSFTAGLSKSESHNQVVARDKELGISRSEITFLGGTGDITEVSSSWVSSLEEKSVPIFTDLALTRLADLLTATFFPDQAGIATKQKLLNDATTLYIKERGGDEGGRIRYGHPVQLGLEKLRLAYAPKKYSFPAFFFVNPAYQREPGESIATFIIRGVNKKDGEEVLAGEAVNLEIVDTKQFAIIKLLDKKIKDGPTKDKNYANFEYGSTARPEGEWTLRIINSGQAFDGPEMVKKKKPIVSGDQVMLSRYLTGPKALYNADFGGGQYVTVIPNLMDPLIEPYPGMNAGFTIRNA